MRGIVIIDFVALYWNKCSEKACYAHNKKGDLFIAVQNTSLVLMTLGGPDSISFGKPKF